MYSYKLYTNTIVNINETWGNPNITYN